VEVMTKLAAVTRAGVIPVEERLAEAEAWLEAVPLEIRWLYEDCIASARRLRAELAAKEAECERLLRENLELKMQPVFDEYRP